LADKNAEVLSAGEDSKGELKREGESLGTVLTGARERRGWSIAEALKETRIPDHYLRMMESNDYSMISDQLYVLPFLRRYAICLKLDPEELTTRFVREVQRADNAPPSRAIEPIEMDKPKRRNWTKPVLAAGLIAMIAAAWILQSHHWHAIENSTAGSSVSDQKTAAQ
jgi:cytoskeletal protein RodZ